MIYVTGDMHGDPLRPSDPALRRLKKGDTLLICGDFGFVWDGSPAEQKRLRAWSRRRYTVAFLDGRKLTVQEAEELKRLIDGKMGVD